MNLQPTSAPSATEVGKPVPPQPHRWLHFLGKLLLALAILVLSVWLMDFSPTMPWRVLILLLPVLALGLFLWILIDVIRRFDERIQRIELHAFVIASGVIAALWFAAGLLQSDDVIEIPANQALLLVFPGIFLVYGIVKLILMWRDLWGRA